MASQWFTVSSSPEWIATITSGCAARKRTTARARSPPASRGIAATRSRSAPKARMRAAADSRLVRPTKARSTSAWNRVPSREGTTRLPLRSNRGRPVITSSCAISRLTCGCEVWSRRLASVMDPVATTARKASMCRKVMRRSAISDPYARQVNRHWTPARGRS